MPPMSAPSALMEMPSAPCTRVPSHRSCPPMRELLRSNLPSMWQSLRYRLLPMRAPCASRPGSRQACKPKKNGTSACCRSSTSSRDAWMMKTPLRCTRFLTRSSVHSHSTTADRSCLPPGLNFFASLVSNSGGVGGPKGERSASSPFAAQRTTSRSGSVRSGNSASAILSRRATLSGMEDLLAGHIMRNIGELKESCR